MDTSRNWICSHKRANAELCRPFHLLFPVIFLFRTRHKNLVRVASMVPKTSLRSALALGWICVASKWRLIAGLALVATACGFAWGYWTAKASVILSLKLSKDAMDEQHDLARLFQSETFLNEVAGSSVPGLTGAQISSLIDIEPSQAADTIRLKVQDETSKKANSLADAIAASATRAVEQWRALDGKQATALFDAELERAEEALESSTRELIAA